jgi:hypothetical protein
MWLLWEIKRLPGMHGIEVSERGSGLQVRLAVLDANPLDDQAEREISPQRAGFVLIR